MDIVKEVENLISKPLLEEKIYVDNITYDKEDGNFFLRIIITSDKGVDLDECIKATKIINPILDENDSLFDSQYILDVCSKGGN